MWRGEKYIPSNGCVWAFSNTGPFVNARWLLDIMEVFPDVRFAKPQNNISAIYFHSEDGDGVCFPFAQIMQQA